ncbi:hypothetical protein MYCTH_2110635 [Thermothelomyces thermophilus ATCC 42464]|uniref:Uncharacterized protein n=1 Tax=Thermothelomyces thermophilus (strain ATCC 42464 / BCRC 31852 / DSM 1799) TaxID=573729 RepID=G2QDD2_THET4|nr:uncharacterized protein MYCTH_2110635 [Thermothelomyces thermophilus ATCC 42464]AEO58297.1 hypothetical protein MYCTH_2110635 [Thermothelomyces thermophilus ATCC 42464]
MPSCHVLRVFDLNKGVVGWGALPRSVLQPGSADANTSLCVVWTRAPGCGRRPIFETTPAHRTQSVIHRSAPAPPSRCSAGDLWDIGFAQSHWYLHDWGSSSVAAGGKNETLTMLKKLVCPSRADSADAEPNTHKEPAQLHTFPPVGRSSNAFNRQTPISASADPQTDIKRISFPRLVAPFSLQLRRHQWFPQSISIRGTDHTLEYRSSGPGSATKTLRRAMSLSPINLKILVLGER